MARFDLKPLEAELLRLSVAEWLETGVLDRFAKEGKGGKAQSCEIKSGEEGLVIADIELLRGGLVRHEAGDLCPDDALRGEMSIDPYPLLAGVSSPRNIKV